MISSATITRRQALAGLGASVSALALSGCAGLDAELIAERIRHLVHEFGGRPPEDDLALLVLQAE